MKKQKIKILLLLLLLLLLFWSILFLIFHFIWKNTEKEQWKNLSQSECIIWEEYNKTYNWLDYISWYYELCNLAPNENDEIIFTTWMNNFLQKWKIIATTNNTIELINDTISIDNNIFINSFWEMNFHTSQLSIIEMYLQEWKIPKDSYLIFLKKNNVNTFQILHFSDIIWKIK